ncbi:MAG: baseplate J/gp47 family protein [Cetobacterium sp.]|uniref:baseplate J/gp47 family protein n=1 Tax=Cetobacterium sp. TaxID=2071632 RepID=UPI003F3E0096
MTVYNVPSISEIENEMLANISDDYIKEVGTFTRDMTKSFAIESYRLEKKLEEYYKKLDIYNLSGDELTKFVKQRKGVIRKEANKAKGVLTVEGNGTIVVGNIFETESGIRYVATEQVTISGSGTVKIEAVIAGINGNVGANSIILIPITIQGISRVTNKTQLTDGYDEETDDSLRERYLIEIQKPATSGNMYHYMQWGREVVGVGDVRVFPLWQGNNTVQMVVIDDNKVVANEELINRVQNYVDPKGNNNETWGSGAGQAPIGAYCTVSSATAKTVNINSTLILKDGYNLDELKPLIEIEIKEYLKNIAFKRDTVSYAILSSWILNVEGVQEWTSFTINGLQENVNIGVKEVPVLGSVTLNVA